MWEYVLGGATVFGAIVASVAYINGKLTRRILERHMERLEELIVEEHKANRETLKRIGEMLSKLSGQHETMISQHETMIKMLEKTLR